ncbi:MAG: 3-hydroxyacyl-CoA dehydrogenase NAD-binding domain-containing protein [Candidatus Limnocylindrales bacterium]
MNIDDVRRVLIIGSGTMGQQIGLQCATHGYAVVLYDIDPGALDVGMGRLRGYADEEVRTGVIDATTRDRALAAITTTTDPATAAAEADLVSESVPEDPALKGRVLAQFNALCPARTIFTTNTSTLLPSMFAAATGRPDRVVALHFHPPVWSSNVADVMPHPGTSAKTTDLVLAFARRIGQVPIHLRKESYGTITLWRSSGCEVQALTGLRPSSSGPGSSRAARGRCRSRSSPSTRRNLRPTTSTWSAPSRGMPLTPPPHRRGSMRPSTSSASRAASTRSWPSTTRRFLERCGRRPRTTPLFAMASMWGAEPIA